jgi:hypothetical protein
MTQVPGALKVAVPLEVTVPLEGMSSDDAEAWLKTSPAARKPFPGSAAMDDIRPI